MESNWYLTPFEERKEPDDGPRRGGPDVPGPRRSRSSPGRPGIDDWEWGVTLFGVHPDDLKECVYSMRFDEASARFAEFGPFFTGMVAPIEDVLDQVGVDAEGSIAEAAGGHLDALRAELLGIGRVVVAFSGGADSAFLAWVATDDPRSATVLCVTAVSPSLAPEELADCRALAAEWGLPHLEVATGELADPAYAANDGIRCCPLQGGADGGARTARRQPETAGGGRRRWCSG